MRLLEIINFSIGNYKHGLKTKICPNQGYINRYSNQRWQNHGCRGGGCTAHPLLILADHLGAKYLVFVSSCCLKTRKFSFAQFVYFLMKICLFFNFWMVKFTIMSNKTYKLSKAKYSCFEGTRGDKKQIFPTLETLIKWPSIFLKDSNTESIGQKEEAFSWSIDSFWVGWPKSPEGCLSVLGTIQVLRHPLLQKLFPSPTCWNQTSWISHSGWT